MWRLVLSIPAVLSAYCTTGNYVAFGSNLGRVALQGSQGTIDDETNCPGQVGMIDLTNLKASLLPGGNYTLDFQATTCEQQAWVRLVYAYIDYNGNEIFEPNELLAQQWVDSVVAPIDVSFPFVVPCFDTGAKPGLTRLRVWVVESGSVPEPCLLFYYGAVKDFTIEILNQPCVPPSNYCKAGNTVAQGSNLGAVDMLGVLQTSIRDNSNCPGGTGVQDFTNFSASVMRGGTYQLNLDVTTCNGQGFRRLAYAYIDFNSNEIYDPDELVGMQEVGGEEDPVDVAFQITVPCNAAPGKTRLRVFVAEGARAPDPCLIFEYGGVKEYSIMILSQLDKPCLPPARYCKAGNLQVGDSNLGAVQLKGVQGTAINDNSDCPNTIGIKNLTDLSASVQPGGFYALSFQVTTCGLGWDRFAYAYVDFNADSVFQPSEMLDYRPVDDNVLPVTVSFPLSVPCVGDGALVGSVRLRIVVVEGDRVSPDPCSIFNYGAVKEFTINILNKPMGSCLLSSETVLRNHSAGGKL